MKSSNASIASPPTWKTSSSSILTLPPTSTTSAPFSNAFERITLRFPPPRPKVEPSKPISWDIRSRPPAVALTPTRPLPSQAFPMPTNVKQARVLVGDLGYFCKFVGTMSSTRVHSITALFYTRYQLRLRTGHGHHSPTRSPRPRHSTDI